MASFFGTSYGGKKHVYTEITPIVREKIERERGKRGKEEKMNGPWGRSSLETVGD
jgi:hypothetical protein